MCINSVSLVLDVCLKKNSRKFVTYTVKVGLKENIKNIKCTVKRALLENVTL